jgi:hypothetical protein
MKQVMFPGPERRVTFPLLCVPSSKLAFWPLFICAHPNRSQAFSVYLWLTKLPLVFFVPVCGCKRILSSVNQTMSSGADNRQSTSSELHTHRLPRNAELEEVFAKVWEE